MKNCVIAMLDLASVVMIATVAFMVTYGLVEHLLNTINKDRK